MKYLLFLLLPAAFFFLSSNAPLSRWLLMVCVILLVILGIIELQNGIFAKDGKKMAEGFVKLMFGVSGLLFAYHLLGVNWLFVLNLAVIGISVLIEQRFKSKTTPQ